MTNDLSFIEKKVRQSRHWWDLVRRKPVEITTSEARLPQGMGEKHCIILHGWHSTHGYMRGIERALWNLDAAQPWRFWQVTYDTHWKSSRTVGAEIVEQLRATGHDFSDTIVIGYSMGGVVARQMIAQGFPCRALVSLCAPHEGFVPWLPALDPGAWSLNRRSGELAALNDDPADIAARERLYCFAITYRDRQGFHDHDGIVPRPSALGESLGPVALRHVIELKYRGLARDFDPHIRAMDARFMRPALDLCADLLGGQ